MTGVVAKSVYAFPINRDTTPGVYSQKMPLCADSFDLALLFKGRMSFQDDGPFNNMYGDFQ